MTAAAKALSFCIVVFRLEHNASQAAKTCAQSATTFQVSYNLSSSHSKE